MSQLKIFGFFLFLFSQVGVFANEEQITEFQLESAIVGDREQPAVSYFIPWKGTSTPDKLQWNLDIKHDETLDIVDRDVMLRSMNIYEEMNLEAPVVVE